MSRRPIETATRSYVFAEDDPVPLAARTQALLKARVVDELTDEPPHGQIRVRTSENSLSPRVMSDGSIGLAGIPRRVFPSLAKTSYVTVLTVEAEGFVPRTIAALIATDQRIIAGPSGDPLVLLLSDAAALTRGMTLLVGTPPAGPVERVVIQFLGPGVNRVTLRAAPANPVIVGASVVPVVTNAHQPTNLGDIALHREPVTIAGRTTQTTGAIAGATVTITGVWRTQQAVANGNAASVPNLGSVHPPLYADRANAASVQAWTLNPLAGSEKDLLDSVGPGNRSLRLSNSLSIAQNDILIIDSDQQDLVERVSIRTINAGSPQPATVELDHPLRFAHRSGARILKADTPQAVAGSVPQNLAAGAAIGDTTLFLVAPVPRGDVRVSGGGSAAAEYHRWEQYSVLSDADGYYRFPPLSRVARIRVFAERPAGGGLPLLQSDTTNKRDEFAPDYTVRENTLDLVLR